MAFMGKAIPDEPDYEVVSRIEDQQIPFVEFIQQYRDRFPMLGCVYGNQHAFANFEFSMGDQLRFLRICERVLVETTEEYESPYNLKRHKYLPDDYSGTFELSSDYPDGHTFTNVADLIVDFPDYVLVSESMLIPETDMTDAVTIHPGDKLKLIRKRADKVGRWIECEHVKTDTIIALPFDMKLKATKKLDSRTYRAHQLESRFPVRVRKADNKEAHIRGLNVHIPGIKDDYNGDMVLSRVFVIEVELQDGSEKKIEIPSTLNFISVVPFDPKAKQPQKYGPITSVHDIVRSALPGKPVFASLTESPEGSEVTLEQYGLKSNSIVVVHSVTSKEGILVKGQKTGFLIPAECQGKFEMLEHTYRTPYELIEAGFKGKVRATNTCEDYELDKIFENDKLQAISENVDSLQPIILTRSDKVNIVELKRTVSRGGGHLGMTSVPGHVEANLVASPPSTQHHTLAEFLEKDWTEYQASFISQLPDNQTELTNKDALLAGDSPFQILGSYRYSVTNVVEYDTHTGKTGMTRAIPNYVEVQAQQLLMEPFVDGDIVIKAPLTSITKLPAERFERLATIVKPSFTDNGYEDMKSLNVAPEKSENNSKPPALPPVGNRRKFLGSLNTSEADITGDLYDVPRELIAANNECEIYDVPDVPFESAASTRQNHSSLSPGPSPTLPKTEAATSSISMGQDQPTLQIEVACIGKYPPKVPPTQNRPKLYTTSPNSYVLNNAAENLKDSGATVMTSVGQERVRSKSEGETKLKSDFDDISNRAEQRRRTPRQFKSIRGAMSTIGRSFTSRKERQRLPNFSEPTPNSKVLPIVEPPRDGKISHFTVEQVAGLMIHLNFSNPIVDHCVAQQIDGEKLCRMDSLTDEELKKELRLESDVDLFAIRHFIHKSMAIFHYPFQTQ